MKRISLDSLAGLSPGVARPAYDPSFLETGVVHFGPGAFHRAHQAAVFDHLAATDPRWGICGVSLHSAGVRDALKPQDGLYTLAILDDVISYRVIGALREVLVAPDNPETVFARLITARIVTSTVTEKGYCLAPDGTLDLDHPDIVHDLAGTTPKSFIGYVAEGLRRRHAAGIPPFLLIPCDNLPSNGHKLKAAVMAFAARKDAQLAQWIGATLQCPCTMVDSITPATDDALRVRVAGVIGAEDTWPIQREAFTQWVIETHDYDGPDWQSARVTLTDDVPAYERAKLRLLNGAHSTLAYAGLLRGHETVHDAMRDTELADFVRSLMVEDIVPLLDAPAGFDLPAYAEAILKRFRNPAIRHLLSQIAWDGSQKLPIRILGSLRDALAYGRDVRRFGLPLAAWMQFIRKRTMEGGDIVDPLADTLRAVALQTTGDISDVERFLELRAVFPADLAGDPRVIEAVTSAYSRCLEPGRAPF